MENFLTKYVNIFILALAIIFTAALYKSQDFQLDASSDTLILENDQDLKNYQDVIKDYESKDFLLITITSKEKIITNRNIDFISRLSIEISKLTWVDSVQSILDVPVLKSGNQSLVDLVTEQLTIKTEGLILSEVEKEFIESPIFSELIISKDGKTSGIIINLKSNDNYINTIEERNYLRSILDLSISDKNKLKNVEKKYNSLKKYADIERGNNIQEIRYIISKFKNDRVEMHLGGVAMIADDTISYVKNDILIFGIGIVLFIIFILYLIFRDINWIFLCLMNCIFSLIVMIGSVSFLNWKVTVISSNFISLMLILTLSMTIHIIVRYRNLIKIDCTLSKTNLIIKNMSEMIRPCIFTALTTIFAFFTLYFSGIKPIMDFGLMMCLGLLITLISSFTVLPTLMMKLNLNVSNKEIKDEGNSVFVKLINHYPNILISSFLVLLILGIYGTLNLKVENSFVNYFKSSTEIYKGMSLIDNKLGGTTPLEIIIQFKDNNLEETDDEFLDFGFEYDLTDYWFTKEKIDLIKEVHDYIDSFEYTGKVLSLASVIRVAEELNSDKEFDNLELSVIYKKLPKRLKSQIFDPYLSINKNQARLTVRMIDTHEDLKRDEFLKEINFKFQNEYNNQNYSIFTTGILVLYNNMLQSLFDSQIYSLAMVMIGIFIMLSILFRSWKLALIGMLPNIAACMTILGIMGIANIPLDLMTITIAAITVGIAVDNCIHYIYRFQENYLITGSYTKTISICNQTVGRAITNTSLTIIAGFSILIFSNFWPTIYFGIFTALAMLIALVGSLTLLPIMIVKTKVFK